METDSDYTDIMQHIERRTGIKPSGVGKPTWVRSIRKRMEACESSNIDAYARLVASSPIERQELVELIVVPETWFFRDSPGLDFFLSQVLEAEKRGRRKPWHVLSLGCATGEEPYSIAMMLAQAGIPLLRFSVEGVDISRRALERARKGVYGSRAFRGSSVLPYRKNFLRTEEGSEVRRDLRQRVAFRSANISDLSFGFSARKYDFVFCRNVLIYFSSDVQDRVLTNVSRLLEHDGYLLLSPTESELVRLKGYPHTGPRLACAHQLHATDSVVPRTIVTTDIEKDIESVEPVQARETETEVQQAPDPLVEAQQLANEGHLDAAWQLCLGCLNSGKNEPALYYLMGALKMAQHSDNEAEEFFRKAVYLSPTHYDALVNLALIAERKGLNEEAYRLWLRARKCSTDDSETEGVVAYGRS